MEKNLSIHEIIDIEIAGIVNTINDYTREHFIRNYTSKLLQCSYPSDKDTILRLGYRLIEWYSSHIDKIEEDQYLHNKHEHHKSIKILNELIEGLLEE